MRTPSAVRAAGIALWLTATAGCAPSGPAVSWTDIDRIVASGHPGVPQMTTAQLAERLAGDGPPVVLLDAREAAEYAVSHLAAARHAPSVDAAARIARQSPPDAIFVIYCSVGIRSSALAEKLQERGIEGVHNLQGSVFAWANEGRPVYRGRTRVAEVHPFDAEWGRLLDAELHAAPCSCVATD